MCFQVTMGPGMFYDTFHCIGINDYGTTEEFLIIEDKDECGTIGACGDNEICHNIVGSYACVCERFHYRNAAGVCVYDAGKGTLIKMDLIPFQYS